MGVWGNHVDELQYPKTLVNNLNERASKLGLMFLVVAVIALRNCYCKY